MPSSAPAGLAARQPEAVRWAAGFRARWLAGGWREALAVGILLTAWSLAQRGFSGGRWSDVPIIKSFVDPRLYRQDPFIWTLHEGTPAAYPYQLIATVARALPGLSLDQALFIIYLPATIAALALLYRIGLRLSGDSSATVLFLVLYVAGFRLLTVGSAILHSAEATPQTLALPFQLASIYALLVGRLAPAGLLMGLAFNLHAPTTVYLAAAIGLYEVLSLRRLGVTRVAKSLALLALAGGPTIVGSLLLHGDQLPLWALNLAKTELATDISIAAHFSSRPFIVYNVLGLALAALALRAAPSDAGRRLVLLFGLSVVLMWLAAWLFFDLSLRTPFSTLVARLQLPRSAWILDVFGLLYLARFLVLGWRESAGAPSVGVGGTAKINAAIAIPRPLVLLIVAAMLSAQPDFVPLDPLLIAAGALVLMQQFVQRAQTRPFFWWSPWALALVGAVAGAAGLDFKELDFALSLRTAAVFAGLALGWGVGQLLSRRGSSTWLAKPEWLRSGAAALAVGALAATGVQRMEDWVYYSAHKGGLRAAEDFQEWARTQTHLDSVFLILPSEPNNNTFYKNAERAVFLVRERANQAVYFHQHSLEFERRVRALGIEQPLRYREELDPAFRRLTEEQVRGLARDFGVTHFVPARTGSFSFPVVYQSGGWTVYEVH